MPRDMLRKREHHTAYMRSRYQSDPEHRMKQKARVAVAKAVKYGRLQMLPCNVCGNEKSQAHHPDYKNPLDVVWLCRECHAKEHGGKQFRG